MSQKNIFPESERLKQIIYSHDWRLYDATLPEGRKYPFSWDEIEQMSPAEMFEIGRNYLFSPLQKKGQTKKEAYSVTKGIGPAIVVESLDDHADMDGEAPLVFDNRLIYCFSRLIFDDKYVIGMSPQSFDFPSAKTPILVIPYRNAIQKFEKLFKIISPEDLHIDPEDVKNQKYLPVPKSDPEGN